MRFIFHLNKKFIANIDIVLVSIIFAFHLLNNFFYINKDGLLYLSDAFIILENNLNISKAYYGWPFYSYIVSLISYLFSTGPFFTFKAINFFLLILVYIYWRKIIYLFIKKNKYSQFLILIIFLSHFKIFDYSLMIFRDIGYWLAIIMASYYFILINNKKYNDPKKFKKRIIKINLIFIFGLLFRIESIFIYLLSFFSLLVKKFDKKFKVILFFNILIFGLIAIFLKNIETQSSVNKLTNDVSQITIAFNLINFLNFEYLYRLFEIFITRLLKGLNYIYPIFIVYGYSAIKDKSKNIILIFFLSGMLILITYLIGLHAKGHVSNIRYYIPYILLINIFTVIGIFSILDKYKKNIYNRLLITLMLILIILLSINKLCHKKTLRTDIDQLIVNEKNYRTYQ